MGLTKKQQKALEELANETAPSGIMIPKKKYDELRRVVRAYLHCISYVPMRAIDCDQRSEERLRDRLIDLSGFRG
jgi:hypothetical protein